MSNDKPSKPTSKILPRFAQQIENWNMTLQERFLSKLEHVSTELESCTIYHAPDRAMNLVSNFIGEIRQGDFIATGDVMGFNKSVYALNAGLAAIKFVEPPRSQRVA